MKTIAVALFLCAIVSSNTMAAGYCGGASNPSSKIKCCAAHPDSPHCK